MWTKKKSKESAMIWFHREKCLLSKYHQLQRKACYNAFRDHNKTVTQISSHHKTAQWKCKCRL